MIAPAASGSAPRAGPVGSEEAGGTVISANLGLAPGMVNETATIHDSHVASAAMKSRIIGWAGVLLVAGCAPRRPPDLGPSPGTDPQPPIATPVPDRPPLVFGPVGLPEVPLREGPLALTVVYPPEGTTVSDRKSTRLNSSHSQISYAVFCLKK